MPTSQCHINQILHFSKKLINHIHRLLSFNTFGSKILSFSRVYGRYVKTKNYIIFGIIDSVIGFLFNFFFFTVCSKFPFTKTVVSILAARRKR